jgi:hypothetical protein
MGVSPFRNRKSMMNVFHLYSYANPGYVATIFSPNIVAYASLHSSGKLAVHPMQCDPSSSLISVVLAQKFTNALKKNTAFDDIYLVAEQYMSDGFTLRKGF